MAIVLDFVKRYLPGLPPNPSEMQVREKMKEVITQISKIVGENLTMLLDSGINYIYSTIERALSGIEFYKKEVVMQKVREFLKEKVKDKIVEALTRALSVYADHAVISGVNPINRPENIIKEIVASIKAKLIDESQSLMNTIVDQIKTFLENTISDIMNQAENAVNQQLQQVQQIINQVKEKIEQAKEIIKQAITVIQNPIEKGPELLFTLLKPWIPPIFLKILVIINHLYSVFSSAVSLFKYIKNMGTANIILKGIGLGTTSASLVMTIYQTYNDISEVMKEAGI
jgi:phage-related protein